MLFSPSAQQALRALIFLAGRADSTPVLVREIADAERIPRPFLSKLLHTLRNRGIVKSTKGPGGGYALARAPEKVRVCDIVETFDGSLDLSKTCVLGLDECSDASACALHEQWKVFRERYTQTIASLTLREVSMTLASKRAGGTGRARGGSGGMRGSRRRPARGARGSARQTAGGTRRGARGGARGTGGTRKRRAAGKSQISRRRIRRFWKCT